MLESWNNLIELYEAWGKPEKAKEWRLKLAQIEAAKERHNAPQATFFTSSQTL
jgi:hypothetical protein